MSNPRYPEGYLPSGEVLRYIALLENCLEIWGSLAAYRDVNPILSRLTEASTPLAAARGAIAKEIDDFKKAHPLA